MQRNRRRVRCGWVLVGLLASSAGGSRGGDDPFYALPDLDELRAHGMRAVIETYRADERSLTRYWDVELSARRRAEERAFARAWLGGLEGMDFEALGAEDRVDWLLLDNELRHDLRRLELEEARWAETAPLLPFAAEIVGLQEARRQLQSLDPARTATRLAALHEEVERLRGSVRAADDDEESEVEGEPLILVERLVANRAAQQVRELSAALGRWFGYYDGYDPLFGWWCREPYTRLEEALDAYALTLREDVAGVAEDDEDTILGDPIGREALVAELASELIAYSPEELLEIAEREFAWCDAEMLRASEELGFGDDWRAALEHVKSLHVAPGAQPELIRALAQEAVDFLEEHELLTIPAFAKHVWRMEMMSPERQKYTPYFTGGEVISVSFPTGDMAHADKLMSMRGNNVHFSRATVHHELIPGHHLQQFMTARHRPHRRAFGTPFWGEGWALYWEMLLWDLGFPKSPEDRVGMLFWRRHRCARILFSLGFHLGELTPDECIALLMERVGHEKKNATAEVRRSVQGGYGPLYQAAYMVGGLQFRALRREVVEAGLRADREFHDQILRHGSIPVELVRAIVSGTKIERDFRAGWRFYD